MEKIRENTRIKGITLIALVITIIVLLILAGISISMLSGDNSILKQASNAREKTGVKSLKEEAHITLNGRQINSYADLNNKTLKEELESGINGADIEEIVGPDGVTKYTDVYYVKKDDSYVTVYEDGEIEEGKVEIWDGEAISCPEFKKDEDDVWNWYIYKPSELKFLADFVNNGNSLTGTVNLTGMVEQAGYNPENIKINYMSTKVYLMNNLDLGAREIESNTLEGKWETEYNKSLKWTPIGKEIYNGSPPAETLKAFIGVFLGNNNSIRGIYVDESKSGDGYAGLFSGYVGCVRDLTLKNSYIKGKKTVGGIASLAAGSRFKNCKNINSVVIATSGYCAGGIVATSWRSLENCVNESTVIGKNMVGGIVGQLNSGSMTVENCKNTGNVEGDQNVGGIVGNIYNQTPIFTGCINEGEIKGKENVSGIIGSCGLYSTPSLKQCNNYGEIEGIGTGRYIGGIIGQVYANATLNTCKNKGLISGKMYVGGIIGNSENEETSITNCENSGKINIIE